MTDQTNVAPDVQLNAVKHRILALQVDAARAKNEAQRLVNNRAGLLRGFPSAADIAEVTAQIDAKLAEHSAIDREIARLQRDERELSVRLSGQSRANAGQTHLTYESLLTEWRTAIEPLLELAGRVRTARRAAGIGGVTPTDADLMNLRGNA